MEVTHKDIVLNYLIAAFYMSQLCNFGLVEYEVKSEMTREWSFCIQLPIQKAECTKWKW